MTEREFISFMDKIEKLKCNTRHSWTSTDRRESVAEHSWRLCMMAFLLEEDLKGLDTQKLLTMCLIHDLGEAVTGDIPSFLKTEKDSKVEEDAVVNLCKTLPQPQQKKFLDLFEEMNEMKTMEAKVYKGLDKMEAVIQHNEASLDTWLPLEFSLQQTYGMEEAKAHEKVLAIRKEAFMLPMRTFTPT